jgi:nucleoside diphosphate kinase
MLPFMTKKPEPPAKNQFVRWLNGESHTNTHLYISNHENLFWFKRNGRQFLLSLIRIVMMLFAIYVAVVTTTVTPAVWRHVPGMCEEEKNHTATINMSFTRRTSLGEDLHHGSNSTPEEDDKVRAQPYFVGRLCFWSSLSTSACSLFFWLSVGPFLLSRSKAAFPPFQNMLCVFYTTALSQVRE